MSAASAGPSTARTWKASGSRQYLDPGSGIRNIVECSSLMGCRRRRQTNGRPREYAHVDSHRSSLRARTLGSGTPGDAARPGVVRNRADGCQAASPRSPELAWLLRPGG